MRRILTEKHGNRPPQYSEKIDQNWAFDLVLTVLCVYHHSRSRTAKGRFSSRAAWGSSPSCYFHRRTGIPTSFYTCSIKYFSQIHTWRVWKHAWTIFNVITPPPYRITNISSTFHQKRAPLPSTKSTRHQKEHAFEPAAHRASRLPGSVGIGLSLVSQLFSNWIQWRCHSSSCFLTFAALCSISAELYL